MQIDERLSSFINKRVLIGITYVDETGQPVDRKQFHGLILRIDSDKGVVVLLNGSDSELCLPAKPHLFKRAEPGEYELKSTGEIVVNPDLLTTWTMRRPTMH